MDGFIAGSLKRPLREDKNQTGAGNGRLSAPCCQFLCGASVCTQISDNFVVCHHVRKMRAKHARAYEMTHAD